MGATRKRTRSSSDSMPDPTSLGWASVRECPPRAYIGSNVVERFFNRLNVVRGIGFAILCAALAAAAISSGGWAGWLIGSVLLALALYGLVGPWLWPKYRSPDT